MGAQGDRSVRRSLPLRHVPVATALMLLAALFLFGALRHPHFADPAVLLGLLGDYAFVGIAAVGATLVIVAGGIDLSVGSVVACSSILIAERASAGWHPLAALALALPFGALLGAAQGALIRAFALPAFLVTLAGMYAVRALGFVVHPQNLGIAHPFYASAADIELELPFGALPLRALLFLLVLAAGHLLLAHTRFGRALHALGGSERAARSMGIPLAPTTVLAYAAAGACSALAGFAFTLYQHAGDPAATAGLELDVIAAAILGGTLLSGGVGSVLGTLLGVLILGTIRLLIDFEGTLDASWTSIATGGLLLAFLGLQRGVAALCLRAARG